ncbi:dihydrolipoyl dehydrogenase [Paraliobacillus ryukyuensis]|uniref:Dihydrolipoyl dehydrogenase n=1 Tax=Paraliobacillus ryukyuensis TaxID=200904 RepID=A0A366EGJ1_9BACI|nr:dihydrolipoyl dehydrogenase [Paraliobacillus ryukyuensis]RBP01448.1 dihydrolipoamide dehydrogenase [Paraliobacillus ryukyuensis]
MTKNYDLVILGGGTGGYVAAIRATQLGLKTAIVEKDKLGGTCLHRGCIPSKALLKSASVYQQALRADSYGITVKDTSVNFSKVQDRKQSIVDQLHQGVVGLMKKGKIDVYEGIGRLLGPSIFSPTAGTISVEMNDGSDNEMLVSKNVIIATGSTVRTLPNIEIDGEYILSSDDALELPSLPESMIIVGGGVIGVEWASMLADFGVQITIIESAEQILPAEDQAIVKEMQKQLKKKGVSIYTNASMHEQVNKDNGMVQIQVSEKEQVIDLTADKLLLAVGRQAITKNIGLENTDIQLNEAGFIQVNEHYQTKESHIYAIGDCIGGMQLAHVASHEGKHAVEHIAGEQPFAIKQQDIPVCIYSNPEIAHVGLTEKEALNRGYDIEKGSIRFQAIGKALINGTPDGFVKIISDKATNDVLGIHIIGANATELISEAGLAKVLDAVPWEIGQTIHPHPSMSEAIAEAALDIDHMKIHG